MIGSKGYFEGYFEGITHLPTIYYLIPTYTWGVLGVYITHLLTHLGG